MNKFGSLKNFVILSSKDAEMLRYKLRCFIAKNGFIKISKKLNISAKKISLYIQGKLSLSSDEKVALVLYIKNKKSISSCR